MSLHNYGLIVIQQTTEEADQLLRSTKKMKRGTAGIPNEVADREDVEMMEMVVGSPLVPDTAPVNPQTRGRLRASYRDTLQRNNPNLEFETLENPIWEDDGFDEVSEDDEPPEEDDPTCPTILLTAAEKLRKPARRKPARQQMQSGGRPAEVPGLNRDEGARHPGRRGQNLVSDMDKESRESDARRVHQLSNNHDPRLELASSDAQDQGSRFRALANLDLNIEMDPALEREDVQGDKEEDLFHVEGTGFGREINGDFYAESRTEMATVNTLGKENLLQNNSSPTRNLLTAIRDESRLQCQSSLNLQAFRGPTSSHSQAGPIASGTVDPRTTHRPGHSFSIQHGSAARSNMQHTTIEGGLLHPTSGRGLTNHYWYPVGDTSLVGVPPDKNRSLGRESNESRQLAILDGSNQSPEVGGCYNAGHGTREAMRRCELGSSQ
ncbi:hypothetical protein Cgig2_032866 [Carnegiea gigantea]|uniref:Uncharacterized protein n=1 Tax=Carnegiea gigantea TaxID=171969 RepID=A0A9Q1JNG4_9CARY|nr:hypothetical protein Cgig2_032866 [Carnegiea gigantea]